MSVWSVLAEHIRWFCEETFHKSEALHKNNECVLQPRLIKHDSDSDSEIIYSATYHTIKVFTYITYQYNGPRRPPLRQNYVADMGVTQMNDWEINYSALTVSTVYCDCVFVLQTQCTYKDEHKPNHLNILKSHLQV